MGRIYSSGLVSGGDESSIRDIAYELVGVGSLDADGGDSSSRTGSGGGLILDSSEPGELYPESSDSSPKPKVTVSSSGVRRGTIVFQVSGGTGEDLGEGLTWADGEYFNTISVQR